MKEPVFCKRKEMEKVLEEWLEKEKSRKALREDDPENLKKLKEVEDITTEVRGLTAEFRGYHDAGYSSFKKRLEKMLDKLLDFEERAMREPRGSYLLNSLLVLYGDIAVVFLQLKRFKEANIYASAYLEVNRTWKKRRCEFKVTEGMLAAYEILCDISIAAADVDGFEKFWILSGRPQNADYREIKKIITKREQLYTVRERTSLVPVSLPIYLYKTKTIEEVLSEHLGVSIAEVKRMV
jgi:hypothetical protein